MPELPEIEFYRRLLESRALHRRIERVIAEDEWYLKRDTTAPQLNQVLKGTSFVRANRTGKVLLAETDSGDLLSLRFGMTGVLMVDGQHGLQSLQYSSGRFLPEWNRFTVIFEDGGELAINDPRRLGGVELEPDATKLGIDALDAGADAFESLAKSTAPVKSWLMDQSRIAGVGNLLADEIFWCAGIDPARRSNTLNSSERAALARVVPEVVARMIERGGSHKGDLQPERRKDGRCPKDGASLVRRRVNGRTTFSCPRHQL